MNFFPQVFTSGIAAYFSFHIHPTFSWKFCIFIYLARFPTCYKSLSRSWNGRSYSSRSRVDIRGSARRKKSWKRTNAPRMKKKNHTGLKFFPNLEQRTCIPWMDLESIASIDVTRVILCRSSHPFRFLFPMNRY